jgi:cytochrome c oxidase cbb3-type subunit 3
MLRDGRNLVRRLVQFLPLLIAIIFLAAIASFAAGRQEDAPDPAIERGRKQFEQACGFCHGPDATGARGPDLLRSTLVAHDVKGDLIGDVIRHGRPDKGMPALPLTDAEISDIATFLHARATLAIRSSGLPKVYAVERLLSGNAEAGKKFFNGAGGCSKCHSPSGDLEKVATKYSPLELEARMLYPSGQRATAVVTLASGEKLSGTVVHVDDFMISLRGSSGWYRSFSRDAVKVELQDPLGAHRETLGKLTQADVHNLFAYLTTLK